MGDALTRALREIDTRTRGQDKNLENLAILMARTDERLRKMEEMVIQVIDKRQSKCLASGLKVRSHIERRKGEDSASKDH